MSAGDHGQSGHRGLAGRRVVNTRAANQAAVLDRLIAERGGIPLSYPCIAIVPPADTGPLDDAVRAAAAGRVDLAVFTSANAVEAVASSLLRLGLEGRALAAGGVRAAAVGPRTADATAELLGLQPEVVPATYTGAELGRAIAATAPAGAAGMLASEPGRSSPAGAKPRGVNTGRGLLLLPQSDIAPPDLAEALVAQGWEVVRPIAYVTAAGAGGVDLPRLLEAGAVDAVALTSPSTAVNLLRRLTDPGAPLGALRGVCVACIGPQTAQAAEGLGLRVDVRPAEHTLAALVAALDSHFHPAAMAHSDLPAVSRAGSDADSHSRSPRTEEIP